MGIIKYSIVELFFSSFATNAHLYVVGPLFASQVALTYNTASVIVGLAAQQSGRPDLIRSPNHVLAHL
jgi:hypothetical protein